MNQDSINIKKNVLRLNRELKTGGLVIQNFGNASIRDDDKFYIKPSGVDLFQTTHEDMVEVHIGTENHFEEVKPSVDYPTHKIIYESYPEIKSIIHTHSLYASAFAQAEREIRNLGTTQADFSNGSIPLTRLLTEEEVKNNYEENTGRTIIEELQKKQLNCLHVPGVLAVKHGVFAWGKDEHSCLKNAEIIEHLAKLNYITENINSSVDDINSYTLEKHFLRKNGPEAYYGQ